MKNSLKLNKREDCPAGYYYATDDSGRKWSVVDFGTTMSKHPTIEDLRKAGLFLGWEAFEIVGERMEIDKQFRAVSWEELEKQL